MKTERIYQTNTYCKSCTSELVGLTQKNGQLVIETAQSVFFPEGGGQPSDTGFVHKGDQVYRVLEAFDEGLEGSVYHVTDAPEGAFEIGDEVTLSIDWDKRFVNMQRHCGEHMLSGAFYNLYGGINRGFHMGKDYIAIDIECDGRILTAEEIQAAEDMVNEAIRANYPVDVTFFDSYEESKHRPVRKDVPHEGRVSIVTIGDMDNPYDCIACCGTHPASSSEVGLLAVYRFEPNKGNTRVFFDCGRPALEKLKSDYLTVYSISNSLSTSIEELPHKLELQAEHENALKAQLSALTSYYKDHEGTRMAQEIESQRSTGKKVFVFANEVLSTNDLLKLGFSLAKDLQSDELLLLEDIAGRTALLFSDGSSLKCGDIVKANAPAFNGRGGGRPDNARAAFGSADDLAAFSRQVEQSF